MRIWEILKKENVGKRYEAEIYGIKDILEVTYDINTYTWFNLQNTRKKGVKFPLHSLYLGAILEMEFKEVK